MRSSLELLIFAAAVSGLAGEPENVVLADSGAAKMPIVISAAADEEIRGSADRLAEYLEKIARAKFEVRAGEFDGAAIRLRVAASAPSALERERYLLRSSKTDGLLIEGATPLAIRHGVWDLLHRLGYRQFFPGETWEVVPSLANVAIAVDSAEEPDYASRRIWYGYGFWDHNQAAWQDWTEKNRMGAGFALNTGHAYGRLVRSQQAAFDAHPEFYALVGGERRVVPEAKLCVSNPGVKDAAIAYALEHFENNPEADSVSMDPSDGGNWCECEACAKLGEPNDRALILANTVAEKLGKNQFVGMYAYGFHSPPPTIRVHPNVIISAATGFIKGGLNIDQIVSGWSDKGASIGIREYYSVNTWDRDLPGRARGGNLEYLAETIPRFHEMGARFLSAESSDNWGCNGLGYYFASRAMWDVESASRRDEIVSDFLERSFGPAREPMGRFYELIDGSNRKSQLVYEDLLARMFRFLGEACELAADDDAARRRIDDLILYTRHAELFEDYRRATGPARQAAYEAMIRHSYRIRSTFMVHSYALWRDVANRDKSVGYPENAHWKIPEGENPWKSGEAFTEAGISAILTNGIAAHEPVELGFEPREFSDENLAAAVALHQQLLDQALPLGSANVGRAHRSFFTVVEETPSTIELRITGGLIAHYRDRGNVKVEVWKLGGASETGERETLIAEDASVPPDGVERTIELPVREPGTYRIDVNDGHDLTRVTWPAGQRMSWKMTLEDHPHTMSGRWNLYFYVPAGVERIGLYAAAASGSKLLRPDGEMALDLESAGGAFLSAEVPAGMDGKLWKLSQIGGQVSLLNTPPFLARSAEELVLPKPE